MCHKTLKRMQYQLSSYHASMKTVVILIADIRPGNCYLQVEVLARKVACEQSLASNLTQRQCCCTIGKGWSAVEEPCPRQGSGNSSQICNFNLKIPTNSLTLIGFFLHPCQLTMI
jgi:TB domain